MNILAILEKNSWVTHHIADSLTEMGHKVTMFNYGDAVGEYYGLQRRQEKSDKNAELITIAKYLLHDKGLDFIFCYVYDDFLTPETAAMLSKLDIPMVNYNVDMVNQWYRQIRTAKYFTHILCAQQDNMDNMAKYGANVMYFPMAAKLPHQQTFSKDLWPNSPVTFVGTPMIYRNAILKHLHQSNIPLAIYGKYWKEDRQATANHNLEKTLFDLYFYGWAKSRAEGLNGLMRTFLNRLPNQKTSIATKLSDKFPSDIIHGFITNEMMSAIFKHSKINLGFTRMIGDIPNKPGVNQIKLRDFEVPMAGGFYLVEAAPHYNTLFKVGSEVETWSNTGELLEKIHYYLEHDDERIAIANAAAIRARADHSWSARFQNLFDKLQLTT